MKVFVYFNCILLIVGCSISKTPGFYVGYENLTSQEADSVIFVNSQAEICDLPNNGMIYSINGKQLLNCLKDNDTTIVYRWGPNCSSNTCPLIIACQEYCSKKNYKLYVIAEYYDLNLMSIQNKAINPIFIPNHHYYDQRLANKLKKSFLEDLFNGSELSKEDRYKRFYVFKGDKLVSARWNLFEDKN